MSHELSVVLAWIHILAAIGWMGTAMFLVMVLGPSMRDLQPPSRSDLALKLFPRFVRYVTLFATLTLIAGVLLSFSEVGTDLGRLSPMDEYGLRVTGGAILAAAAYILGVGVGARSARRILQILRKAGQGLEASAVSEIGRLQNRMRVAATSAVVLLMLTLVFMVAASRL